jgi:spermidine synthase
MPEAGANPQSALAKRAGYPQGRGMSRAFEELDYRETPIGPVSLRRRRELTLGVDVFEIKLGDEFLMSSLFVESEIALAHLGLEALTRTAPAREELAPEGLAVVVGGLGLGYTARAVLEHDNVATLIVVEALDAVIDWHRRGLVPLGGALSGDPRCRFVHGDFFALAGSHAGFDPDAPGRRFDAVLLDIDHSPEALLDGRSAPFYTEAGLTRLAAQLRPGGVFGLWSNEAPDAAFTARLAAVFAQARAEPVTVHNPLQDKPFTQTVYLGTAPAD